MGPAGAMLIYDGDCGFCTSCARWIARRWTSSESPALVASQQLSDAQLEQLSLTRFDVASAAWWVQGELRAGGHDAVAQALRAGQGGWRVIGAALTKAPLRWLAAPGYRFVARNRQWLTGATSDCRV